MKKSKQIRMLFRCQGNARNVKIARNIAKEESDLNEMRIRALCPILGSNDRRKRQEMRLIQQPWTLGTLCPFGLNERLTFI